MHPRVPSIGCRFRCWDALGFYTFHAGDLHLRRLTEDVMRRPNGSDFAKGVLDYRFYTNDLRRFTKGF